MKFEAKFLRSQEQFTQTVKDQNNFWYQNAFLSCSWRFLRFNELEQLEPILEKFIWMQEKLENVIFDPV